MTSRRYQRPLLAAAILSSVLLSIGSASSAQVPAAAPGTAARPPAPVAAAPAGPPVPRIIVIDRNVILRASAAGKTMMTQTQALSAAADTEFKTQAEALQKEAAALQQQLAILAADARLAKQKEFTTKQEAFQKRVTDRQAAIQNGFARAGQQLDTALGPILQNIMRDRGANLVLDRNAVILSSIDVDVTAQAITALDKALPRVNVALSATPPAGAPAAPRPAQ